MASLAVKADYLDYTGRLLVATADDASTAADELRRQINHYRAINVRGPFIYTVSDDGVATCEPCEWP